MYRFYNDKPREEASENGIKLIIRASDHSISLVKLDNALNNYVFSQALSLLA